MGCQNSRPVSSRYPQQTFTQSKYDHFFGNDLDSNSSEVTDDSAKNFQQALYTSFQEEGFGHTVRHDLRNCKAQDIYGYSLNLLRWPEEWEDVSGTENFVMKKRYGSIFSDSLPVALVYMDFGCCVSARDIMSVLLEKNLRVKWDNDLEKFDTEYTGKSDEMILHMINRFPIRNRETIAKAAFSKTQDETVIVMYSIEHENILPQSYTEKVDLFFSVMKILEQTDSTLLMFMLQSDDKLPAGPNTSKLKLAQLSHWFTKFSRAVLQLTKL